MLVVVYDDRDEHRAKTKQHAESTTANCAWVVWGKRRGFEPFNGQTEFQSKPNPDELRPCGIVRSTYDERTFL